MASTVRTVAWAIAGSFGSLSLPAVLAALGTLITQPPDALVAPECGVVREVALLLVHAVIPLGQQGVLSLSKGWVFLPDAILAAVAACSCTVW